MLIQRFGPWKNMPWGVDTYADLGWNTWNLQADANEADLNEFLGDIAEDLIIRNSPWLQEKCRSTEQIRKVLFGIRTSDPFCGPRQLEIINAAMAVQNYQGKGSGLNLWWSTKTDY
jgi:hypothetical protein